MPQGEQTQAQQLLPEHQTSTGTQGALQAKQQEMPRHPNALIDWLIRLLKGALVGIGAILPGLSGGVLAVIFGIYDPLMRFLGNLRRNFWRQAVLFLPVVLGGGLGVLLFAGVVEAAFQQYAALFTCLFIGFVAGTFPSLWRTAGKEGRGPRELLIMLGAAALVFSLMLLGERTLVAVEPSFPVWLMSGAIVGLGFIVPGMSPSNFLIYFGLYDKMSGGIKRLDIGVVVPLIIGMALCVLLLAKLVNRLFRTRYKGMYHAILGLVIGSSAAIFPTVVVPAFRSGQLAAAGISMLPGILYCAILFILGTVASWLFSRVEARYAPD